MNSFVPSRRGRAMLLIALAGLLLPLVADAYSVRPHPRILITEEMLPELRQRCQTTHASIFAEVQSLADERIADGRRDSRYLSHYAFVYLMTQDPAYLDYTVDALIYNVNAGYEIRDEGTGPGRISSCVLAYDWLYNDMTPSERDQVASRFVDTVENDVPSGNRYAWLPDDDYWHYALAIYGDGVADAAAASGFQVSYDQFLNRFVPAMDEVGTYGSIDGYGGKRTAFMMCFAEALYTALGEDHRGDCSFIRYSGDFWMHRLRGDRHLIRSPGKWNMADTSLPIYFSYFADRFDNPFWQHQANHFVNETDDWGRMDAWQLVLWYDPSNPSQAVPDTLSYSCTGSGMTYMRDEWDFSPGSNTVHAGFFCGPDLVGSRSQNHFVIARGEDNLLIDSGLRYSDIDDHYNPYYIRAIAHNTVLIYDPNEDFGDYQNHLYRTHDVPNDGGQTDSDDDLGWVHYPHSGTFGWRGEIEIFRDMGDRLYIKADATPAYHENKAGKVVREFVYIRPDLFVVRDQVIRTNPTFTTKAAFHMIDRPLVDGPLDVIHGSLATGGIFESAAAREVIVRRGDSQCQILFLSPDETAGKLRIVGGGNASGEPWKQNWESAHDLTYDPSTSYEFWVDDRNWVSCSQYCEQDHIVGRNEFPGNEAGDWRIEIVAPDGETELSIITVVKVGPDGEYGVDAELIRNVTAETVVVTRDDGSQVTVPFARGDGQGMNY
ncbi:MAG: hypothetical protein GF346_03145 [Candidatus Eisenbacteria bacterium]|nr:hypothetical protein [Candidatus Latescibacterota bacterium]MBD3301417.1 hypothetical protein [Candidatus Eisenbacteria bacterium]